MNDSLPNSVNLDKIEIWSYSGNSFDCITESISLCFKLKKLAFESITIESHKSYMKLVSSSKNLEKVLIISNGRYIRSIDQFCNYIGSIKIFVYPKS